jgi:hypothetical protein
VTQVILPAFTVAGIVDAGSSRERALLRAGIISLRLKLRRDEPIQATTKCVNQRRKCWLKTSKPIFI